MKDLQTYEEYTAIVTNKTKHNKRYLFIDFYAHWCGPCRTIAPTLDKLSQQYAKNTVYCKINVDIKAFNPTMKGFKITCMPTLVLYDMLNNTVVGEVKGADEDAITKLLEKYN